MTSEVQSPALSRFLEASHLGSRVAIMPLLHAELARAEATFEPVLKALKADAALGGFVRHAACSAYFGGHEGDCNLEEAFSRMGVREFYRLLGTAVAHTRLALTTPPAFVTHADHVARLCELIANHCAPELAVNAYFAGLYHDAAVPAMCETLTDFQYFADQALSNDPAVLELERECNEFTHCDAGARVVAMMGFAPALATAVRHHHEPQRMLDVTGDDARLLAMVLIAERVIAVSQEQSASVFTTATEDEVQQACWQALALDAERFQSLTLELLEHCRLRRKHG